MSTVDPFNLSRFVTAQEGVFDQVVRELKQGHKESHWMWFIFPQFQGLGKSPTAAFYAIKSRAEAEAFLDHPVLGPRLLQCSKLLLEPIRNSATDIFASPDDLKLRSCMTLFAAISKPESVFSRVLDHYYGALPDPRTLELLELG